MFGFMKKIRSKMSGDRRAVTALEYGLIAAVIGGVVIGAATQFGGSITKAYTAIGAKLEAQVP
jgi:Flp pilus assembly pilin Flp